MKKITTKISMGKDPKPTFLNLMVDLECFGGILVQNSGIQNHHHQFGGIPNQLGLFGRFLDVPLEVNKGLVNGLQPTYK